MQLRKSNNFIIFLQYTSLPFGWFWGWIIFPYSFSLFLLEGFVERMHHQWFFFFLEKVVSNWWLLLHLEDFSAAVTIFVVFPNVSVAFLRVRLQNVMLWRNLNIPYKIKVFMWLVHKNGILITIEVLSRRWWSGDPSCSLCLNTNVVESRDHLFILCHFASQIFCPG